MLGLVLNAIRLALGAILRNKTRATLTVLGILIGISAVVIVTALADAASSQVSGTIDGFAANAIFVHPQPVQASGARQKATGRLTENDMRAVKREAVSVTAVAPWLSALGQVIYKDENTSTTLIGTNTEYLQVRKYKIGKGEMWTELDEQLKTKVCVLGQTVVDKLFAGQDPVGQIIRIGRSPYRVIGVLAARGNSPFGDDQDDRIMMPIGSFRARVMHTSPGRVDQFMASAASPEVTDRAQRQIDAILRQRHHIQPGADPDFQINTQAEFQKTTQGITTALSALLLGVATISLLVGGIGVMNIMLVSVAERTREIGIRMSIGARAGDILTQFLIEAVVLSLLGGLLGILIGVGATMGIGRALGWAMAPSIRALAIAVATSVGIGVAFGFLPARHAAHLDPIDALRTD